MRPAKVPRIGRRGVVIAEFALVAPIFFLIALATTDVIQVFRAQLRAETVAVQIGQIVSQCRSMTAGDFTRLWTHAQNIGGDVIDVNSSNGGAMMVSGVGRNSNANRLYWQRRTGNVSAQSRLGTTVNGTATISDSFIVPDGQALMVTEVYSTVRPFVLSAGLIGSVLPATIYGTTLFLTRAPEPTTLLTAPSTSTTPECTA